MPGVEDVKEPFSTLPFFTVIHQHGNKSDRPKQHKIPLGRTWKRHYSPVPPFHLGIKIAILQKKWSLTNWRKEVCEDNSCDYWYSTDYPRPRIRIGEKSTYRDKLTKPGPQNR